MPETIERFGGKFLARGGRAERLEGNGDPARIVVLEFESVERAKAVWDSEEYREAKATRRWRSPGSRLTSSAGGRAR